MKKFCYLSLLSFMLLPRAASAYDFVSGGIYYNITSAEEKTCEVTYEHQDSYSYSGDVDIPESVDYNGTIYSVTGIGDKAFQYCSGLTSVVIPNSVTTIGDEVFQYCSSLTSVVIPNSVTTIGCCTFDDCISLTSVTLPNALTYIDEAMFAGCTSLTSVEIPSTVTRIGVDAFYDSGITSIILPNSVTYIEKSAFDDCTALESFTFGTGLDSIAKSVFTNCPSLTRITGYATTPPVCDEEVFDGVDKTACALYVPEESVELYKAADQWKDFYSINGIATGIESPVTDAVGSDLERVLAGSFEVYNLSGQCVARSAGASSLGEALSGLARGVYVLTGNGATYKAMKQ